MFHRFVIFLLRILSVWIFMVCTYAFWKEENSSVFNPLIFYREKYFLLCHTNIYIYIFAWYTHTHTHTFLLLDIAITWNNRICKGNFALFICTFHLFIAFVIIQYQKNITIMYRIFKKNFWHLSWIFATIYFSID